MSTLHNSVTTALTLALVLCAVSAGAQSQDLQTQVVPGGASPPRVTKNYSVPLEKDTAASVGHHHYNSDAERAQDDLLITEVRSVLMDAGISKDYPVQVDADHGTVTLTGIVASADEVQAAARDAGQVHGVVAVRNQLRPHE